MSKSKGKKFGPLRVRIGFGPQKPTVVRRFLIDRESSNVREIEPAGTHSVSEHEEIPLIEWERLLREQAERMAANPDPYIQSLGQQKLAEINERLAQQRERAMQPKKASKAPRPGRRNPVREKIVKSLRKARRRGSSFSGHLDAWLIDEQDRLLIERTDDGRYVVTDDQTGDETTYTRSTLEKLWNNAV